MLIFNKRDYRNLFILIIIGLFLSIVIAIGDSNSSEISPVYVKYNNTGNYYYFDSGDSILIGGIRLIPRTELNKIADDTINYQTAFGWGDHSAQSYINTLTGFYAFLSPIFFDTTGLFGLVGIQDTSVISEGELSAYGFLTTESDPTVAGAISTHSSNASAHHTKTTDASELTSGLLPQARIDTANAVADAETKVVTGNAVYDYLVANYTLTSGLSITNWNTAYGWGNWDNATYDSTNFGNATIGWEDIDTTGSGIGAGGGLTYFDEADATDTSVLTPTSPNTSIRISATGKVAITGGVGRPEIVMSANTTLNSLTADSLYLQQGRFNPSLATIDNVVLKGTATIQGDLITNSNVIQRNRYNHYEIQKARIGGHPSKRVMAEVRGVNGCAVPSDTNFIVHPWIGSNEQGWYDGNKQLLMYYTPYICSDTQENIHAGFSNDGQTFTRNISSIAGDTVANPIATITSLTPQASHLADPCGIVDIYDTSWVGWRASWDSTKTPDEVDTNAIYVQYTADGKTYSTPIQVLEYIEPDTLHGGAMILAPSFVKGDTSEVIMFVVHDRNNLYSINDNCLLRYSSPTSVQGPYTISDTIIFDDADFNGKVLWHAEIRNKGLGEYIGMFSCADTAEGTQMGGSAGNSIFIGQSFDKGITWATKPNPILEANVVDSGTNWDDGYYYKSTFLFNSAGYIDLWFSNLQLNPSGGANTNAYWGVGKTQIYFDGKDTVTYSGTIYDPDGITIPIPLPIAIDTINYPLGGYIAFINVNINTEVACTTIFSEYINTSTEPPALVNVLDTLFTTATTSQASVIGTNMIDNFITSGNTIWWVPPSTDINWLKWEIGIVYEEHINVD